MGAVQWGGGPGTGRTGQKGGGWRGAKALGAPGGVHGGRGEGTPCSWPAQGSPAGLTCGLVTRNSVMTVQ